MRTQRVFASIATAVVVLLVAWGFIARGTGTQRAESSPLPSRPAVSPSPSRAHPSGLPAQAANWHLTLDASFSGSRLDTALWATCYPWMDVPTGCTSFTKRSREHEWYLPSQVRVRNGVLQLIAKRLPTPGQNSHRQPMQYTCRSGMVTTYRGFRFKYGYVKILAQIPSGAGLWPALWLAASNLRWPPEVDILEHWGPDLTRPEHTGLFFHPVNLPQFADHIHMPSPAQGWHTFGLLWSPSELTWYIDGHLAVTTHIGIPHQSMYVIANVAEAAPTRPGWGCQGTMAIRSVQVWQPSHR